MYTIPFEKNRDSDEYHKHVLENTQSKKATKHKLCIP